MPTQQTFGRRGASRPQQKSAERNEFAAVQVSSPVATKPASVAYDQELEEWKAARKQRLAPSRAPWRTFVVIASIGFAATSWLLPKAVADVADAVFTVMGLASFYVGYRGRRRSASQDAV